MTVGHRKTVVHKPHNRENLIYEANLSCSTTLMYMPTLYEENKNSLPQQHTEIVDSGATHLYIAPNAPH